jgi:hypothetical protein
MLRGFCIALAIALPCAVAGAQWDVTPSTGSEGPYGPAGPDGICGTLDDFDGINNLPDLRGPDGLCGTGDDQEIKFFGTGRGGGSAGCFTNNTPNCVGAVGGKSAEWDISQKFNAVTCVLTTTFTNTSDGEPGCPNEGCVSEWNGPAGLPNFNAAMQAALPIAPGTTISADDGGNPPCSLRPAQYRVSYNPESELEPLEVLGGAPPVPMLKPWALAVLLGTFAVLGGVIFLRRGKVVAG